jgi:hypothetical protein
LKERQSEALADIMTYSEEQKASAIQAQLAHGLWFCTLSGEQQISFSFTLF